MGRKKLETFIKTIIRYLYPMVFFLSIFANTVSYYLTLGNENETIRKIISWGIILLVCGISVGYFLICVKEKRRYIFVFVIPAIMFVGLCITLVKEHGNVEVARQIIQMLLYGIPALTFAIYAIEEKMGIRLFQNFWISSIFLSPMYVLFVVFVISKWQLSKNWSTLGGMSYLSISYSALFLFFGMILYYIWGKQALTLKYKILYFLLNFIQVLVITKGGSRGAVLVFTMGVCLILLVALVKKQRRKACILLGGISIMVCISLCLGEGDLGKARWSTLLDDLKSDKFVSAIQGREEKEASETESKISEPESEVIEPESEASEPESEVIEPESEASEPESEVIEPESEASEPESEVIEPESEASEPESEVIEPESEVSEPESEVIEPESEVSEPESEVSEPESENKEIESILQSSLENKYIDEIRKSGNMARIYLYKWAINDIVEHPFMGLGAYGYQLKYGTYPHNVLLHLLVDYGIPATVLILLWLLRCLYYIIKKDSIAVILFSSILGATIMLSGGIYDSSMFIWIISYVQAAVIGMRYEKHHEK